MNQVLLMIKEIECKIECCNWYIYIQWIIQNFHLHILIFHLLIRHSNKRPLLIPTITIDSDTPSEEKSVTTIHVRKKVDSKESSFNENQDHGSDDDKSWSNSSDDDCSNKNNNNNNNNEKKSEELDANDNNSLDDSIIVSWYKIILYTK